MVMLFIGALAIIFSAPIALLIYAIVGNFNLYNKLRDKVTAHERALENLER